MQIRVARITHPSPWVRLVGVHPRDRYVEACWMPLLGAGTVELLRSLHVLAGPTGTEVRAVHYTTLSELLGLPRARREPYLRVLGFGPPKRPTLRSRARINGGLRRAHHAGVLRWQPAGHQLELYEPLPIVEPELICALAASAQQQHRAHLDNLTEALVRRLAGNLDEAHIRDAAQGEPSLEYLLRRLHTAAGQAPTAQPPQVSP